MPKWAAMSLPPAQVVADAHANVLSRCVVPLFGLRGGRELRLFGSGTLVQVGAGDTFLFTAGHVSDSFEHDSHGMWIWKDATPVKIVGEGFTSEPKRLGRTKDRVDLAYLRLAPETAHDLTRAGVHVIDATAIAPDHPRPGIYAVIGYPLGPNEPTFEADENGRKVCLIHAQHAVMYATGGDEHDYGAVRRQRRENIVLRLAARTDVRAFWARRPKDPRGMSGGAIFYLGTAAEITAGRSPMELAGILTEAMLKRAMLVGASTSTMADILRRSSLRWP